MIDKPELTSFYWGCLVLEVRAGAEIYSCLSEAFKISLDVEIPVRFSHNDKLYVVNAATARERYLAGVRG